MKTPNYKDTESKHPIPHAKGIAEDDNRDVKQTDVSGKKKKIKKKIKKIRNKVQLFGIQIIGFEYAYINQLYNLFFQTT